MKKSPVKTKHTFAGGIALIRVGLSGWGDHEELIMRDPSTKKNKLKVYSAHFPIVELDSSFYAIQSQKNYYKWIDETPSDFSFIVKAYQGMTGHQRDDKRDESMSLAEMFERFTTSIEPLLQSDKLKVVLFQYPPWFDCRKENVNLLRYTKQAMRGIPIALEFRNQTWFVPHMREKTLRFMEQESWVHSICDEPQAGIGSVPTVLQPTNSSLTVVRLHGRNTSGWNNTGQSNWRAVRYLYRYSRDELMEWVANVRQLLQTTDEVCVIFNNNSGGDAAANGLQFMEMLGVSYQGWPSGTVPLL